MYGGIIEVDQQIKDYPALLKKFELGPQGLLKFRM